MIFRSEIQSFRMRPKFPSWNSELDAIRVENDFSQSELVFSEIPVVLSALMSEVGDFPFPSCFEHGNRL
jgi:hypothetical protein